MSQIKIKRWEYKPDYLGECECSMEEEWDGTFVRYEDVRQFIPKDVMEKY
jgi:hypothetical protein